MSIMILKQGGLLLLYVCGHNRNRASRESGGLFVGVLCKEGDEDSTNRSKNQVQGMANYTPTCFTLTKCKM